DCVFGAGALLVIAPFEVAGVVKQNRQEHQFEPVPVDAGFGAGAVPAMENAGQAEGARHGVLKVMITSVDGLVVGVASAEAGPYPLEDSRNKLPFRVREHPAVDLLNLLFDFMGDASIDLGKHACVGWF